MWAMRKVEVIPDVVGAIPKGLNKSLQNISIRVRPGHVQKAALLELQEYYEESLRYERWPDYCDPWLLAVTRSKGIFSV